MPKQDDWMKNLLLNNRLSDVVLVCEDSLELAAHSLVLRTRSEVFDRMLDQDKFQEGVTRRIVLKDVDFLVAKYFLRFLYCQDIPDVSLSIQIKLLQLCHLYQIKDLVKLCEEQIISKTTRDNVCELLETVSVYSEHLKHACKKIFGCFAFLILSNEQHLCLSKETLLFLMREAPLFVENEEQVVRGLLCWGEFKCASLGTDPDMANMKEQLTELLALVKWRQKIDIRKFGDHALLLSECKSNVAGKRKSLVHDQTRRLLKQSCKLKFYSRKTCETVSDENTDIVLLTLTFKNSAYLVGLKLVLDVETASLSTHFACIVIEAEQEQTIRLAHAGYHLIGTKTENSKSFTICQYTLCLSSPLLISNSVKISLHKHSAGTLVYTKFMSHRSVTAADGSSTSGYFQSWDASSFMNKKIYFY